MDIIKYPDSRLRYPSKELYVTPEMELMTPGLELLGENLYKTMKNANGLGLAAIQAGVDIKMFVTSLLDDKVIINPTWEPTLCGFEYLRVEGCLSFPGWLVPIKRFDAIKVKYYNIHGSLVNLILKGLAAQVFQHETDHLLGVLMIDYLTEAQRATILRQCRGSK